MTKKHLTDEPYRLFFPIGILFGIWGVFLWLPFTTGYSDMYPVAVHPIIMMGGFLSAFAFGFLMTAIPRFTQTFAPSKLELLMVALPLLSIPLIATVAASEFSLFAIALSLLGLIKFSASRFLKSTNKKPPSFVFIGLGLASALVGVTLLMTEIELIAKLFRYIDPRLQTLGRLLFFQGFMFSLVLGVGSKLIPVLTGHTPMPLEFAPRKTQLSRRFNPFILLGAAFIFTFVLEVMLFTALGQLARALIAAYIAVRYWLILKLPPSRSKVAWSIWLSAWFTIIGFLGVAILPHLGVHFLHVAYIAGFALMTLMIATRVTLAHGGFSLSLESDLSSTYYTTGLLLLAALTRLAAGLMPAHYFSYLTFSALAWIFALVIWALFVGRLILTSDRKSH